MKDTATDKAIAHRFVAVGAGRMGRGIAIAFAYAGYPITLLDLRQRTPEAWKVLVERTHSEINAALVGLVELDVMDSEQVPLIQQRIDILSVDQSPKVLSAAEIVFECVPETLQAKEQAYNALNEFCSDEAILTSTTSSILVTDMVKFVKNPERFFNMHWLNPAYIIPVVEVSYHHGTQKEAIAKVRSVVEAIGKLVVICGPAPGYIVPRLQALIMNEAARMVEEGVASAEEIDKATRYGLGLRFAALGVLEFIDFGGAEILQRASHQMEESIDQNRYESPTIVENMIRDNKLGLKSGEGFYKYEESMVKDYQSDVLNRTLSMLRHVGMFRPPAD